MIKKMIALFTIVPLIVSCNGQTMPLDKAALDLEKLDFSTRVSALLPERTREKKYDGWYQVKSSSIEKVTVYDDEYGENRKPIWTEYRQRSFSSRDELAKVDKFNFNTVNLATALDGELMVVNGVVGRMAENEIEAFVKFLNKKYGTAIKTKGEFMKPFDIYTWKLKDRLIKYVPLFDNEASTLNVEVDKDNNTIKGGEKKPHYKGLVFVVNHKHAEKVVGNFHTGDLLYCQ